MEIPEKTDSGFITSINPATLEVNGRIRATPVEDIPAIFDHARDAQRKWAALSFNRRLAHLIKAKDYLMGHLDETARTITVDNGKPLVEAINSEIYPVLDMFRFCARDAKKILAGEKLSNPVFPVARIESENVFAPLGVITIISPWNFPFAIPMTQIIMALITGNAVVFKPAEITALTGEMIGRIFSEAGLPDGVLNVVQGRGSVVGDALVDLKPDRIVFTGSVPVGKRLMARAAENLIPITLELGGKDPFIVLPDADLDRATSAAVWGAFINAGQVCASVERVYVHRRVADRFIAEATRKTARLRVGNGLAPDVDVGPLISEDRIATVAAHVADAVKKGARALTGGKRLDGLPGWFYQPTVLTDVNHDMECMTEETFGPTLPIMVYDDIDEAVRLANESRYGLTASVWSRDIEKAREVALRLETGVAVVNNCLLTYGFAECPWGGVKESGIGRTHSAHGLLEFTSIKNLTVNRALLKEDLWWYPYSEKKLEGMKNVMKALFCGGMLCRGNSLLNVLKTFGSTGK